MTPRISPQPASSFERWRRDGDYAPVADRAIWNYLTQRGLRSDGGEPVDPLDVLQPDESGYLREHRVLSKGASGGGFLVPKELADRITSAARAAGVLAREAAEFVTESGAIFNAPVAGTHGTGAWIAESGSYTPSDETITNVALSAFKGGTKIIVSEELLLDESVSLPDFLAGELGSRLRRPAGERVRPG